MNIRKQIVSDLQTTMESEADWGLPVELVGPNGSQSIKKDSTDRLSGQILYNITEFNPDTGEDMVIEDPVVILRLDSLENIPSNGEKWVIKIPEKPDPDSTLIDYILSPTRAMKFNRSIGFVRIYLSKAIQI